MSFLKDSSPVPRLIYLTELLLFHKLIRFLVRALIPPFSRSTFYGTAQSVPLNVLFRFLILLAAELLIGRYCNGKNSMFSGHNSLPFSGSRRQTEQRWIQSNTMSCDWCHSWGRVRSSRYQVKLMKEYFKKN